MSQSTPAADVAAISADELSFSYGDVEAVKGISFEIAPGEIFGFLGPNGAGKTTTIKMLTGQLRPKGGSVRILGRDVGRDDPVTQAQIGVCFEEKNLYDAMSGEENLRFFAALYGAEGVDTDALLRRVGLADRAKDRVGSYSKGMRQRLMVARSLLHKPKVLIPRRADRRPGSSLVQGHPRGHPGGGRARRRRAAHDPRHVGG